MTVKEFMRAYHRVSRDPLLSFGGNGIDTIIRPRIECKDGFTISVQGSTNHYCDPREDLFDADYSEVELGYPSEPDDWIADYAEDDEDLCHTVYGWVPIELVEELIEKHGGIRGYEKESAERLKKACNEFTTCSW